VGREDACDDVSQEYEEEEEDDGDSDNPDVSTLQCQECAFQFASLSLQQASLDPWHGHVHMLGRTELQFLHV
jgi:hypothetical protein